jgi:hypothetical protein
MQRAAPVNYYSVLLIVATSSTGGMTNIARALARAVRFFLIVLLEQERWQHSYRTTRTREVAATFLFRSCQTSFGWQAAAKNRERFQEQQLQGGGIFIFFNDDDPTFSSGSDDPPFSSVSVASSR